MFTYEIDSIDGGHGWIMSVHQDGEEIAGGTFTPGDDGYCEAIEEAETIIESMGGEL